MPFFKKNNSIRYTIFTYFTISALVAILLMGVSLYTQMSAGLSAAIEDENQSIVNQLNRSLDSYLRTVMKLSDSLYYGVIKNADLSESSINSEFTLLYDNNKDNVENIALISEDGELLEAVPAARLKEDPDVTKEGWFASTLKKTENIHFTNPKVQHIFDSSENQYRWVLPISRAVEITQGGSTTQGVLLIDVRYDSLEQLFDNVSLGNGGYVYLMSSDGELIYHPKIQLIDSGLYEENNGIAVGYKDGSYKELFQGKSRMVTVKSVGYTGWKLVGVTPNAGITLNSIKAKLFVVFLVAFFLFILMIINAYISSKITDPIKELERSVGKLEEGVLDAPIYAGGSYEIEHLGASIQKMADQIKVLMNDIVVEHESKRRSEFDTLQSQINPHFLYNTLEGIRSEALMAGVDSIAEMTEALSTFFRYTISQVNNLVTLEDELANIENYYYIQQFRFGDKLELSIEYVHDDDTDEADILTYRLPKLTLQPVVENSIYHGIEEKIGKGHLRIRITATKENLIIKVSDDGMGIDDEKLKRLNYKLRALTLDDVNPNVSTKGGIAIMNVNNRIKLLFGEKYGVHIYSQPGVGTDVEITLPIVIE
ncbi:MAG: sensor histidine kinase [Clostridium sp.]